MIFSRESLIISFCCRYYGTIKDINDFVEADIQWGATSTAWISSLQSDTEVGLTE